MITKVHLLVRDNFPIIIETTGDEITVTHCELTEPQLIGTIKMDQFGEYDDQDISTLIDRVWHRATGSTGNYAERSELTSILKFIAGQPIL